MPLTTSNKEDNITQKPGTRRNNSSVTIPEDRQDIKNMQDGRKFLEKHSLLCPPGEPVTNAALAACLHQISAMNGVSRQAINAIRATAFMLEEMEIQALNDMVREALNSHITELTSDMKLLVEDADTKIEAHLKDALEQISKATAKVIPTPTTPPINPTRAEIRPNTGTGRATSATATTTYASALINPPPHVNPKIAARESIKVRQLLLMGIKESPYGQYDTQQLKAQLNKILKSVGQNEGKVSSVITQKDGNTLIEVDSDALATWFANQVNRVDFCTIIGDNVAFKSRNYNVIAFNVPLNLDTANDEHKEEINEANGWARNTVTAIRWAKPLNRRSPNQRSAHLILMFIDPVSANRAITSGITICNKKCHAEKVKKEPVRCLRCQGWNHMARDCAEPQETCSNCAENHRAEVCTPPETPKCASCNVRGHASWSRECPIFLRKTEEFNERNPENLLPFFPTVEPWTWSTGNTNAKPLTPRINTHKYSHTATTRKQEKAKETRRNCDTYIPDYGRWTGVEEGAPPPPHNSWWDDEPQASKATQSTQLVPIAGPSGSTSAPTQPSNTTITVSNATAPSNQSSAPNPTPTITPTISNTQDA
jgi:hypothetical protein